MQNVIEWQSAGPMLAHYQQVRRRFFPVAAPTIFKVPKPEPEPEPEPEPDPPPIPEMPHDAASIEERVRTAILLTRAMFARNPGLHKIAMVQTAVAQCFGMTVSDLISHRRKPFYIVPRHICFALARALTNYSTPEIGRKMKRDHTTILYGISKYRELVMYCLQCLETPVEEPNPMSKAKDKALEALILLMGNPHVDLGDLVYQVREREGRGWDGPAVLAWSQAVTTAKEAIKLSENEGL